MTTETQPDTAAPVARPPAKNVYAITEREGAKSFWTRIGTAWTNRDGSLTIRLDALPVNGVMQVRDADPEPEPDAESGKAEEPAEAPAPSET